MHRFTSSPRNSVVMTCYRPSYGVTSVPERRRNHQGARVLYEGFVAIAPHTGQVIGDPSANCAPHDAKGGRPMLRKPFATLLIAALAGTAGIEAGVQQAAAMPLAGYIPMANMSDSNIQPARWVYVRGRHGPRYRHRRGAYRYY